VARPVDEMDASIGVEPEKLNGEVKMSLQPADSPGQPNSLPPLTPDLGLAASTPSEHAEVSSSAEHLLRQASGGQ